MPQVFKSLVNFRVTDELLSRLRELCKIQERCVSEICREALEDRLKKLDKDGDPSEY